MTETAEPETDHDEPDALPDSGDGYSQLDGDKVLDYCSEMHSLASKVAALHLKTLDDPTVVASVNEIEDLTTGLSRKIWQKIDMVRSEDRAIEKSS